MQGASSQVAVAGTVADLAAAIDVAAVPRSIGHPRGGQAISLPPGLAGRAFGTAWIVALAAHAALLTLVLLPPAESPPEAPLVRMVFVEPPPPPPAPLGVAGGQGILPVAVEPEAPRMAPEPKIEAPRAPTVAPKVMRRPAPAAEPKARPRAVEVPPAVSVGEAAPGMKTGSVGGEAGGVAGGVVGGIAGGVVGGTGTGPVPAGRVAHPPVLLRKVPPAYPAQARRAEIEGLVMLEAVLDRDGRVEPGVKVLTSIPMLDEQAVAAVRKWRFRPARNERGETLRVVLEIPIRFVLR